MRCMWLPAILASLLVVVQFAAASRSDAQQPFNNAPAGSGGAQPYQGKAAAAAQATARSNQINQGTVGTVPLGANGQSRGAGGGPRINYANPNYNAQGYGTGYNGPQYGDAGYGVVNGNSGNNPVSPRAAGVGRPTQGSTPQGNQPGGGLAGGTPQYNPKAAAAAQAAARSDQLSQGAAGQNYQQGANPTGNAAGANPNDPGMAGGDADVGWRYRYHNGAWWYWGENNQWMYHRNGKWNSFAGAANVAPNTNMTPNGPFDPSGNLSASNPNGINTRSFSTPYTGGNGRVFGQYDPRTDYRVDPRTPYNNQYRTNTPYVPQVDPRLRNALPGRRLDVIYPNDIWDAYRGYNTQRPR